MLLVKHSSRFRVLLLVVQTVLAALFGGVGLWQRNRILSHPFLGDQTLWESTARFHVWPWPFKFAVVSNMPAFIAGLLLTVPINFIWPHLPEAVQFAPSLIFIALQWYWVGHRLDGRCGAVGATAGNKTVWILLLAFTAVSAIGTFLPIGYVGYQPYGVVVWLLAAGGILRMTKE